MKTKRLWLAGIVSLLAFGLLGSGCSTSRSQKNARGKPRVTATQVAGKSQSKAEKPCDWQFLEGDTLQCQVHGHRAVLAKDTATGKSQLIRLPETAPQTATAEEAGFGTPFTPPATPAATVTTAPPPPPPPAAETPTVNLPATIEVAAASTGSSPPQADLLPQEPHHAGAAGNTADLTPQDPAPAGGGGSDPSADTGYKPVTAYLDGTAGVALRTGDDSSTDPFVLWDAGARYDIGGDGRGLLMGVHSQGIWSGDVAGVQYETCCVEYAGSQGPFKEPHSGTQNWEETLLLANAIAELGLAQLPWVTITGGGVVNGDDFEPAVGVALALKERWGQARLDPMYLLDSEKFAFFGNADFRLTSWLRLGGFGHVVDSDYAAGPIAKLDLARLFGANWQKVKIGINGGYMWGSKSAPDMSPLCDLWGDQRTDAPETGRFEVLSVDRPATDFEAFFVGLGASLSF